MNKKILLLGLLFLITLACQSDPFAALSAKEEMEMVEAIGEDQMIQIAIAKQKQIENQVRYPDFSGADPIENGIWNCQKSSYGGSQFWTASGPNAIFACDALQNIYGYACDVVIMNSTGSDDGCIVNSILVNIKLE